LHYSRRGRRCHTYTLHRHWPTTMPLFSSTPSLNANLANPINTALLIYILYSAHRIIFPSVNLPPKPVPTEFKSGYTWMPKSHPPTVLFRIYTPKTLAKYDGTDGGRILLAINGTVFDVTAGRSFYGPGGFLPVLPTNLS